MLEPTGHPEIDNFSLHSRPGVTFAVSWRQEGAQSAPRRYQKQIFHEFGTILEQLFCACSYLFYFVCNMISDFWPIQRYTDTPNNTDTPIHRYTNYASIMHRWYIDNTPTHRYTDTAPMFSPSRIRPRCSFYYCFLWCFNSLLCSYNRITTKWSQKSNCLFDL